MHRTVPGFRSPSTVGSEQPAAVTLDADWQPYRNGGHWEWTDHGWYWQSDYSWGWAPFHYGRWAQSAQHRWIWIPDNVWGPAWVSWRDSSDYYGWAPLPPGATWDVQLGFSFFGKHVGFDFDFNLGHDRYTFVPRNRFIERDLGRAALPRQQVVNIFSKTTIVKNTYVYNDNRIINQGIPVNRVSQETHQKFEPRHIIDRRDQDGRNERVTEHQIEAFRPKISNRASVDPQTALARRDAEQQKALEAQKAREQETVRARQQQQDALRQQQEAARKAAEQQKALEAQKAREQEAARARQQQQDALRQQQEAARKAGEQQKALEAQKARRAGSRSSSSAATGSAAPTAGGRSQGRRTAEGAGGSEGAGAGSRSRPPAATGRAAPTAGGCPQGCRTAEGVGSSEGARAGDRT